MPEIAQKLAGQGIAVIGGATETARNFIDHQVDVRERVVKENDIKGD